jgi:molybdenum cofactor cytidylyltransferase
MTQPSDETIVGVLLAAGLGSRFTGGNKLLAPADSQGEPVVRGAAQRLVDSPVADAVAVLGHDADRVEDALSAVDISTVYNPEFDAGQATSVAQGVSWAREEDADAALFALGDMPWVAQATYASLVERWRGTGATIVVPTYEGTRGNPVVLAAEQFDALAAVSGDVGGRELIAREPVERVAVDDPGIHRDVDRRTDLEGSETE